MGQFREGGDKISNLFFYHWDCLTYCPSGYSDYEYIDNFCQMDGSYEYCWLCNVHSDYVEYYDKCVDNGNGSDNNYGSYGSNSYGSYGSSDQGNDF